jgi:Holliday junction resolvasome RuvABC endonuclease subunit
VDRIVAIDPGTTTGWAVGARGQPDRVGLWKLPRPKRERRGPRFRVFRELLAELIGEAPTDLVAYERVMRHEGTDAAHLYGGLVAVLMELCEVSGVSYAGYLPHHLKQHATGHGNAHKPAMVASARARPCWRRLIVEDDNAADALWLLDLARTKPPDLSPWG